MFNLSTASMSVRKAAALNGVLDGKVEFVQNQESTVDPDERLVAQIHHGEEVLEIYQGDLNIANLYTWSEIRDQ
jgi:hypothetical protein